MKAIWVDLFSPAGPVHGLVPFKTEKPWIHHRGTEDTEKQKRIWFVRFAR